MSAPYRPLPVTQISVCAECEHCSLLAVTSSVGPDKWPCSAHVRTVPSGIDPQTGERREALVGGRMCVDANPDGGCLDFEARGPESVPASPWPDWPDGSMVCIVLAVAVWGFSVLASALYLSS